MKTKNNTVTNRLAWAIAPIVAAVAWWTVTAVEPPTKPPTESPTGVFSGDIIAIEKIKQDVTVRGVLLKKTFIVPADCQIVTRTKPAAKLGDLQTGMFVDVTYQEIAGTPVARHIAERGVVPAAREEYRWQKNLERILIPTPSERPNN